MSARVLVASTSAFCGVFILCSLASVGYILNDINSFYDDALLDMGEFKVSYSNLFVRDPGTV